MLTFISLLTALVTTLGLARQAESDALRQTASSYLTAQGAAHHLAAATFAGELFSIDPTLLLAIAYRESRFTPGLRGPEVRGKHACGLMQPLMHVQECPEQTVFGGYLEGAGHLREWLDTKECHGDTKCALLGYSGGYSLLRGCSRGEVLVERNGRSVDLCHLIPRATMMRAQRISTITQRGSST